MIPDPFEQIGIRNGERLCGYALATIAFVLTLGVTALILILT